MQYKSNTSKWTSTKKSIKKITAQNICGNLRYNFFIAKMEQIKEFWHLSEGLQTLVSHSGTQVSHRSESPSDSPEKFHATSRWSGKEQKYNWKNYTVVPRNESKWINPAENLTFIPESLIRFFMFLLQLASGRKGLQHFPRACYFKVPRPRDFRTRFPCVGFNNGCDEARLRNPAAPNTRCPRSLARWLHESVVNAPRSSSRPNVQREGRRPKEP